MATPGVYTIPVLGTPGSAGLATEATARAVPGLARRASTPTCRTVR